mgnify:CR=1 FL=1
MSLIHRLWMRSVFAALIGAGGLVAPARAADLPVDVELVLAVDVSRSMDASEQALQRQGYINALRHPEVIAAIRSGLHGRIALTYFEWSAPNAERIIVPWSLIDDTGAADAVAARIGPAGISGRFGTSISSSLLFAASLFENNGFAGERLVIDVSGDGPNNVGLPVVPARDAVLGRGIVINGLPIVLRPGRSGFSAFDIADLDLYYRDCVVGGPGAFTVPVTATDQFETAIRRKLVLEIASIPPPRAETPLLHRAADRRQADCLIGESQRRNWMTR